MRSTALIAMVALTSSVCSAENLAFRRPYTFSHPPNYPYCTEEGDVTDLTDGVRYDPRGTSLWTQKTSVGWAAGDQFKSIEIDLGQICAINGLTFETAADARSQGTFPLAVLVFLSDDGKTYSYAGNLINEAANQGTYTVHTFKLVGLTEQGRFVRLQTIRGGFYVFVDEIEVLGSKPQGLTPRRGELAVESIVPFAKARVPLERQNNSSLTLLAHAESRLAEQGADSASEIEAARAELGQLRTKILARTESEPVDFRRGVPFTSLDRDICEVMGTYLASAGPPELQVRPANPWARLLPFDWKDDWTVSEPAMLLQGEWHELAFNLTNRTAAPIELSAKVAGLSAGVVSLFEVVFVEAFGFRLRADALMPLKGQLTIPPGMTKQLWLSINTHSLEPGGYTGTIELSAGGKSQAREFGFTIAPVSMPKISTLDIVNFSYMHLPVAASDPTGVAQDLREHYVNTQVVISPYLPTPRSDAEGNIIAPMDFTKLDAYLDLLPDTRLWILWTGFEWDHREMYPKDGEPRRTRLFSQWLSAVIAHMKQRGFDYGDFAFHWIDEPSREKMQTIVRPSSELLRQVDPKVQVWVDVTGDNTEESLAAYTELVDIWCPASDKLAWDFWQGKRTWFYDSASDKSRSPTAHYRYKLWQAFRHGARGNAFWTYTDSSDLWDDYAGNPTYSVVYDGPDGVISSKRWDAYRAGVEDFELCELLQDAIRAATAAGDGDTAEVTAAQRALDGWGTRVLDNRDDLTVAARAHQALLSHLLRVSDG